MRSDRRTSARRCARRRQPDSELGRSIVNTGILSNRERRFARGRDRVVLPESAEDVLLARQKKAEAIAVFLAPAGLEGGTFWDMALLRKL